jgi:hypothetical protein
MTYLHRFQRHFLLPFALLLCYGYAEGQVVDADNVISVQLEEGLNLTMYGEYVKKGATNNYYFLPSDRMLKLTEREDGTPEFLFMKYTSEDREGASGGILHFLMGWELTKDDHDEAQELLRDLTKNPAAIIKGPVLLNSGGLEGGSFRITSATLSSDEFSKKTLISGNAPTMPGGKVAAASQLNAEGAQLLAASFENAQSIADVSVTLAFSYQVQMPAFKATASFDWSKFESFVDEQENIQGTRKSGSSTDHDNWWFFDTTTGSETTFTGTVGQTRRLMDSLIEKNVITIDIEERIDGDERIDMIRQTVVQSFMNKITAPVEAAANDLEKQAQEELSADSNVQTKKFTQSSSKSSVTTIDLNYSLPITRTFEMTSNVADWYDQIANNEACITSVNLNDPFFQHRDIHFILDHTAKDMFASEANYVTVNVRKKRSAGNDFADKITIDNQYLSEHGIRASLTYSRGEDKNPDMYEYQAQWSLKGGNVYPLNPRWTRGEWEGVTLAPPIKPRHIEVEADIDDLKDNGITRVTAQVRYRKFGKEQEVNIPVSPARGEPLVEKDVFIDNNTNGYAYRLIFSHKEYGKLATEWESNILDDYMYAIIPPEWKADDDVGELKPSSTEEIIKAMDEGKTIIEKTEEILDQFTELFN